MTLLTILVERDVLGFLVRGPRAWNTVEDIALATGHTPRDVDVALRELELADTVCAGAWGMWTASDQAVELVESADDEMSLADVVRRLSLRPARELSEAVPPCVA